MLLRPTNWLRAAGHDLSEPREKIDRPFLIRFDSIARPATGWLDPVVSEGTGDIERRVLVVEVALGAETPMQ